MSGPNLEMTQVLLEATKIVTQDTIQKRNVEKPDVPATKQEHRQEQ